MGKDGVLWGRLEMLTKDSHSVIYRRNRTVYRREVENFYPCGDEGWVFFRDCLRITRTKRHDLAFARRHLREESTIHGAISIAGRRCNGVRADSFFTVKKNRDRQIRTDSLARCTAHTCGDFGPRICAGSWGSPRSNEPRKLGSKKSGKTIQTASVHVTSEKANKIRKGTG